MNWAGLGNSFQLFVAYFVLAVVVIVFSVRRTRPGWAKWAAGLGTFSVFWGLTLIDDIMGAREHKALCEGEAGVKIYKQVKLPPEFYLPDGRPKFMDEDGNIIDYEIKKTLSGYIKFERKDQDSYSRRYLKIDKYIETISDAKKTDLLAERINFARWPSPFVPSIMHSNAKLCQDSPQVYYEAVRKFNQAVFPNLSGK